MYKYKTIDLFAGVGGVRLGFEMTNHFESVFANDVDPACAVTYNLNFESTPLTVQDFKTVLPEQISKFDILLGGFPCQAFSVAGYRKGFNDDKGRGDLFFYIADIIAYHQPKAFLLENVKNLYSHDSGKTFKIILNTLAELGYYVKYKILNTMEYSNIPQNRERVYIIGFRNYHHYINFNFPDKIPLTNLVIDALEKIVPDKYYYEGKVLFDRIKDDVVNPLTVYQWRRKYVRENKKQVCPTLTANMGTGGHNVPIIIDKKGIRKLTPRECFTLQGFPQTYNLPNLSDASLYKQAGNSVSVGVIRRLADLIYTSLSSDLNIYQNSETDSIPKPTELKNFSKVLFNEEDIVKSLF